MNLPGVLTTAQKLEVVGRYAASETATGHAVRFGVSRQAVSGILSRRGIVLRTPAKLSAAQKAEVVERYLSGETADQIAESFGVRGPSILGILHRPGAPVRGKAQHSAWHEAFDVVTPEAAYWIGLLFADGTVTRRCGQLPSVTIALSACDLGHLERLRAYLRSTHATTPLASQTSGRYTSRLANRFTLRSERLAHRLLSLGRYEGPIGPDLAISRDFWRGVVDGDASIGRYGGRAQVRLCGQQRVLEEFSGFLAKNGLTRLTVRPHKSISGVGTTGRPAERIIDLPYSRASVALDRKAAAAHAILSEAAASHWRTDRARHIRVAAPGPTPMEVIAPAAQPGTRSPE